MHTARPPLSSMCHVVTGDGVERGGVLIRKGATNSYAEVVHSVHQGHVCALLQPRFLLPTLDNIITMGLKKKHYSLQFCTDGMRCVLLPLPHGPSVMTLHAAYCRRAAASILLCIAVLASPPRPCASSAGSMTPPPHVQWTGTPRWPPLRDRSSR